MTKAEAKGAPPQILTIQSRVAFGHVGNAAAVFALQAAGCEAWALDTVALAHHPAHGGWRGRVTPSGELTALLDGLSAIEAWDGLAALLSGYLGSAVNGAVVLDALARGRAVNPNLLFCLDPVMGEAERGLYVAADIPAFFRDRALPLADIVLPNRFEASLLSGCPVDTPSEALAAADALRARGPAIALVTGLSVAGDLIGVLACGPTGAWFAAAPRVAVSSHGAGDAFAALFLARFLRSRNLADALKGAVGAIRAILRTTADIGARELALVAARGLIARPPAPPLFERLR